MRVFVAGASGAVGRRLVPLLVAAGHDVTGSTRSADKLDVVRALGADPVVMDGLDAQSVRSAVSRAVPEVVVHELTALGALAAASNVRRYDDVFALTNRLRTEGTDHLLAAARSSGARRIVVQSFTGWTNQRIGGPVKSETDPIDPDPARPSRHTLAAIRSMESTVEHAGDLGWILLRYGVLYGPGTGIAPGGEVVEMVRKRRLPLVGGGTGVWSFVHIDDAAAATAAAVDSDMVGVYNIVDDDPAPVSQWLPLLARTVGAKPPMPVPAWLARPLVGEHGMAIMTASRGSSNAKARRDLWQPEHRSWRQGFPEVMTAA
jgi:nucleoside-diphosphate-sugar epimerase